MPDPNNKWTQVWFTLTYLSSVILVCFIFFNFLFYIFLEFSSSSVHDLFFFTRSTLTLVNIVFFLSLKKEYTYDGKDIDLLHKETIPTVWQSKQTISYSCIIELFTLKSINLTLKCLNTKTKRHFKCIVEAYAASVFLILNHT